MLPLCSFHLFQAHCAFSVVFAVHLGRKEIAKNHIVSYFFYWGLMNTQIFWETFIAFSSFFHLCDASIKFLWNYNWGRGHTNQSFWEEHYVTRLHMPLSALPTKLQYLTSFKWYISCHWRNISYFQGVDFFFLQHGGKRTFTEIWAPDPEKLWAVPSDADAMQVYQIQTNSHTW